MRLESSYGQYPPEAISFRAPEPIRTTSELEQFVTPREVILFSRADEERDPKTAGQSAEINQYLEPIKTSVNGDWEPFLQEPAGNNRFLNFYNGNYAQDMEINRKRVEQAIKVAGLEGNVVLTSLSYSRTRSIEANPDGSVAGKKGSFWGEKPEDAENPYHRVTSIPEGWRIEICDQRIHDELSRKYSGEKLKKKNIESINRHLRAGIWQAVWKEKLSFTQDNLRPIKAVVSFFPLIAEPIRFITKGDLGSHALPIDIGIEIIGYFMIYNVGLNLATVIYDKVNHSNVSQRNLTSFYEIFMPLLEVDRAARAFAYLNIKGRNLVRLATR